MLLNKKQIIKKINNKKTLPFDKKMLELFYLEESMQNEKELAKLTKHNQKQKAIKKFGEKGLHFEDLAIYYAVQNYNIFFCYNLFSGEQIILSKLSRTKDLQRLLKSKIIKNFELSDKTINIEKNNGEKIAFALLSETILKDEKFEEIKTPQRMNKCHLSIKKLCWELPFEHFYVTGYECTGREQEPKLHTWVEFLNNGKEMIADYTMNVMMDKKDYYNLRHISKICSKISSEEIKNHFTKDEFEKLETYYDMKYVLTNWNKVAKEMNENIFDK